MKYMTMLKKDENTHPDPLQKVQKDLFTVNAVPQGKHIQEKNSLKPDPFDHEIDLAIRLFNDHGVNIMNYPAAVRHKALLLEEQMTQAANENDRGKFIGLVMAWRKCFLH